MSDDVTLPGDGSIVATEDLGGSHYQYLLVGDPVSGRDRAIRPTPGGGIHAEGRYSLVTALLTAGQSSYNEGDMVGGYAQIDNFPTGMYLPRQVGVMFLTTATPVSGADFDVVGYTNENGNPATLAGDGDPYVFDPSSASGWPLLLPHSMRDEFDVPAAAVPGNLRYGTPTANFQGLPMPIMVQSATPVMSPDLLSTLQIGIRTTAALGDVSDNGGLIVLNLVIEAVAYEVGNFYA